MVLKFGVHQRKKQEEGENPDSEPRCVQKRSSNEKSPSDPSVAAVTHVVDEATCVVGEEVDHTQVLVLSVLVAEI